MLTFTQANLSSDGLHAPLKSAGMADRYKHIEKIDGGKEQPNTLHYGALVCCRMHAWLFT